ncbi:MAG: hypothetical protein [Wendovervirus sonii]|uniref:Uncharacterized protein n=1 Tax=phage Lak_Megaphage_Sonny TaxID=3109229 RepID=A0ABZ0Z2P1_9CAUD|nr:MAG: hypothetical protein [phage Lak_Megaphage_Sonny]
MKAINKQEDNTKVFFNVWIMDELLGSYSILKSELNDVSAKSILTYIKDHSDKFFEFFSTDQNIKFELIETTSGRFKNIYLTYRLYSSTYDTHYSYKIKVSNISVY